MKKLLFITFLAALALSFSPQSVLGATGNTPAPATPSKPIPFLSNPLKANNVEQALYLAVDIAIFLGTILAVLMFIWVGFKFVMAQGNDTKLSEAKKWFMYVAIGTAVLISSKVIVDTIKTTAIETGLVNESLFKK